MIFSFPQNFLSLANDEHLFIIRWLVDHSMFYDPIMFLKAGGYGKHLDITKK
jgi:hypothetical protein